MTQLFVQSPLALLDFRTPMFVAAGTAAVAIPIIIHLLNRRRFRTVAWAAMEFLLRAMRKNRRKLKFEQWLLLAVRCLLVFLLGLALARPLGCENGALAQFGRHTALNVFIIDNSYSMAHADGHADAKTHLGQARKLVRSLLSKATSGGESVVIISAGTPANAVVGEPLLDMEAARQSVDRIEQTWTATDLKHAMELALDVARRNDKQPNKKLYIFSDSTRSAWEGADAAAFKQLGPELAEAFKNQVLHQNLAKDQPQWNGAILDVRPADSLVTTKAESIFQADVRGFFPTIKSGRQATLQLKIDDQAVPQAENVVKLDETKPVTLNNIHFASGGPHVLTLNLIDDSDRLQADNVRYRVVDVASELKVLIVVGKNDDAYYLRPALAGLRQSLPGKPATSDSTFLPEVINDLELGNKALGDYSAVILAAVGQISPAESDALAKYVRQGGTLELFMGEAVDKENYNSMLYKRHKLLPGELVKVMRVGTNEKEYNFDFKPKAALHPLLKEFADSENSGLDRFPITAYWQVELPKDSAAERVLNYVAPNDKTPSDPAITAHSLGQGRVIFVSTSANEDWNKYADRENYTPLIHELLKGSVRTGDWWMNRTAGEHLSIPSSIRMTSTPVLTDSTGGTIVVSPPEAESMSAAAANSDAGKADKDAWRVLYHTDVIAKPGMYMLALGDRKIPIAVNVPAADEANVTTLSDDAIRHALGDIPMTMYGADLPTDAGAGRDSNDFSWWTMMLVLALVGFECFIAMKFGHYRQPQVVTGAPGIPDSPRGIRTATSPSL